MIHNTEIHPTNVFHYVQDIVIVKREVDFIRPELNKSAKILGFNANLIFHCQKM